MLMDYLTKRRRSPARITVILTLLVAFASTAWAEVLPSIDSSENQQLSSAVATALSAGSNGAKRDTQKRRIRLIKEKREDRREDREKRQERLASYQAEEESVSTYSPSTGSSGGGADWDAIAQCESGGVWSLNTGNGYWGGLQFSPDTWFAYGGGPFDGAGPFPYSREEQIAVGERVLAAQGPGAWPNCFVGA